jgi:hypothetical protein
MSLIVTGRSISGVYAFPDYDNPRLDQGIKFPICKLSSSLRKGFDKISNSVYVMLKKSRCKML